MKKERRMKKDRTNPGRIGATETKEKIDTTEVIERGEKKGIIAMKIDVATSLTVDTNDIRKDTTDQTNTDEDMENQAKKNHHKGMENRVMKNIREKEVETKIP